MLDRPTTGTARPGSSDPGLDRLRAVLDGWRKSLLDLGGQNRLLNFRHARNSTLELTFPDAATVLSGLAAGWEFARVKAEPEDDEGTPGPSAGRALDRSPGLLTQKTTQASLEAALHQLRSKSGQVFNDYGLWVLWLGVGMLRWRENGAEESSLAPVLLVPVELRRDRRGSLRLHPAEEQERIHNPALAVKLERLGVDWGPVAATDVWDVPAVIAAAREVAATQQRWAVEERVVLGLFASHKEAMYRDLQQNEQQILDHPLVRAVALGPDSGLPHDLLGFEPPELDRIDESQLPEQTPLVLDADASQRQCIAAALEGRSFVMSGPPGTGKSQTITNMIASLMHAGRSVLFVSEKAAALDVVCNRLRGVGLGDFVLTLHSGGTSKKSVAMELARVLTTEVRVTGAAAHELERARRLRTELSAYAAAMNEIRQPLQRTLHDVLGRLVLLELDGTPQVSLGQSGAQTVRTLDAGALHDLMAAAEAVSRAWRPAAEGERFPWRGLVGASALAVAEQADDALGAVRAAAARHPFAAVVDPPRTLHDVHQAISALRGGLPGHGGAAEGGGLPEDVTGSLAQLADLFGMPKPDTPQAAFALLELADLTSAAHRPPAHWFTAGTLARVHEAAQELRHALAAEAEARAAVDNVFGEQVLTAADLPDVARRFAEQHRGLMTRMFSSQFKADRQAVTALTRTGMWDRSLPALLPQALAWQQAAAEVRRLADQHGVLLARYTPRTPADLPALDQALTTAARIAELTMTAERAEAPATRLADGSPQDELPHLLAESVRKSLGSWCDETEARAARWSRSVTALLDLFDASRRAQLSPLLMGSLDQAHEVVHGLLDDPQGPQEWQAYRDGMAVLARHGADDLVPRSVERGVSAGQLPSVVEQAVLKSWAEALLSTDDRLRTNRSADLDARIADFREADRRLVAAARGAVIEACNKRRPRRSDVGDGRVITREAEKKTRHMPVRELLGRTRDVVQRVKPCFMMSPLTVSQFLPADYRFDVVIFDEASQVRPSDAINCIYRGHSLIVAGDAKQLPPTSFFDSSVQDDSDEYDEDVPDSFESLLDACKAGAMQELPLRWHYRSRHEDLITFSNRSFYENSMVTFPGALERGNDVGVAFYRVDGVYDRGGRRDNRTEAQFVAERVIHHFDTRPGGSLGVVALSQAQASAIEQAVQQARVLRPDLNDRFTEDRLDGFFVKNLESVQGDERDVMIMSVGYGPDEHGRLGLNFGPINKDGGWRRLNVAVTRARYRMEVVASFRGNALADSPNESVQHLKRYLQYAENGPAVLALDLMQGDAEPDSPFEESVLRVLRDWGYQVQPQVGVAGYRIDIGLRHPRFPGSYALGIECDGAMYHSSKAARDRDRLREEVLTGLGWRLHRIWGTDWYRGRDAAEQRLRQAVELAVTEGPVAAGEMVADTIGAGSAQDSGPAAARAADVEPEVEPGEVPGQGFAAAVPHRPVPVEHERVPVTAPERPWSRSYETYDGAVNSPYELHTPQARPALERFLLLVVMAEGPVHEDLIVQRARDAWGVVRAGTRIRDNIGTVLAGLCRARAIAVDDGFFEMVGGEELKARSPEHGTPRKFAHIAPAERRLALYELAAECPGMSQEELVRQACEFFGWRRVTKDVRAGLQTDIDALCRQGKLTSSSNRITAVR
ncbi:DUF3320 domain-containing protein [Allostreptomyces psammosilenae]|uniref:Very-short-patch-repair endonuclease n=1 Tax=Allostreptomyces psammosilenae TaxID=1892865 RepID=A0A852ZYZ9_9ACTN|nr:DUF3320 domain-containing protein [Allostreptomyces psammosilenae]NYI03502.1 very-short-patch-repair endonuclease [Allostreptomyces psammosilenae]